ncbi:hypothetical protein [Nocardioides terrisoli]|uniref:hypothetical protein n=1 Tax=Nocardioides terrisoli TaxID=3388267 RepID=UPI00287B736A|nr:hypothetical protein [Nocardioides marmorisolisilvae]
MTDYQGRDSEGFTYRTDDHDDALTGTRYTSRDDAILWEVVKPIQGTGEVSDAYAEYDVEAIAETILGDYDEGYACKVTDDEFWQVVAEHEAAK